MLSESFRAQFEATLLWSFAFVFGAMDIMHFTIDIVQGCITTWSRKCAQTTGLTFTVADVRGFIEAAPHSFKGDPQTVDFRPSPDGPVLADCQALCQAAPKGEGEGEGEGCCESGDAEAEEEHQCC